MEENKKWYVLIGILNKVFTNEEVKELYWDGKVKIYGPYSDDEIENFYKTKKLLNDNIIQKTGDSIWKPMHSQNDLFIRKLLSQEIFVEGKTKDNQNNNEIKEVSIENPRKVIGLLALFLVFFSVISYFYYDVYYCNPKEFYKRLKKNVVVIYTLINDEIKGLGTGFFLKESGLILTNLHVISKATDINIKGGDGRIYTPESVNFVDSTNDLALIKVKEKNLPGGLKLGDPNNVEEGDRVFVIGNPAGFELSLSEGIVSGKRNIDPLTKESRETIQITAPISPGSSGSPVFNKRGKVIGVASLGSKGEIQNINFASTIKPVMNYMAYVDRCYFKFLDRDSEWRYIDSIYTSNTTYSNYYFTNRDYYSFSFYYSPETFTHVNEDVVTVWLNIKGNITTRIESNFFEYLYKDTITKGDFYLLVEVNCKDKVYKNRISFTYFDNQLTKVVDDFSDEGWSDLNQTIINKICSLREN